MSAYKIEVYEAADGSHRFRVKAGNGEIVASSEGYTRRDSAERGAKALVSGLAALPSNPPVDHVLVEHSDDLVPKLRGALEAVLAEHVEVEAEYTRPSGKPLYRQDCRVCMHEYPCPTVRAITEALS